MTREEKEAIRKEIRERGITGAQWNVERVRKMMEREFASDDSYERMIENLIKGEAK